MNHKQLILLLAALIVLGGAGLVLHNRNQQSWDSSGGKLGQKLLPGFQVNDVAAIHIKGGADLDLVKKMTAGWCRSGTIIRPISPTSANCSSKWAI